MATSNHEIDNLLESVLTLYQKLLPKYLVLRLKIQLPASCRLAILFATRSKLPGNSCWFYKRFGPTYRHRHPVTPKELS